MHLQAIERLLPGIEPLGEEDRECAPAIVDAEADCALSMGAMVREVLENFAAGRALGLATEDPLLARALGEAAAYWRLWATRVRLKR